jgi:DNA-binding response OmpR family regulator
MTGRKLLAIDDQVEILDVLELAIDLTTDWTLHTASSAAAALAAARTGSPGESQYDAVLLDLTIPGEDPRRTVQELRSSGMTQAVVLLTGATPTVAERDAIGADGLLSKPFDPMSLAADIRRVLGWEDPT